MLLPPRRESEQPLGPSSHERVVGSSPDLLGRSMRREKAERTMADSVYVGIDVAKDHLDACALPSGEAWRLTNTPEDIDALAARLVSLPVALVVMEGTGGHEHAVAATLAAAGLAVAVVNPPQVRSLRPGHRRASQDRCPRRWRLSAVRRTGSARAPCAPGCRSAGAGGTAVTSPAAHRDAGGRA